MTDIKVVDTSEFGKLKRNLTNIIQNGEIEEEILKIFSKFIKNNYTHNNRLNETIKNQYERIENLSNELQDEKEMGELVYSSLCAYCQRRIGKLLEGEKD